MKQKHAKVIVNGDAQTFEDNLNFYISEGYQIMSANSQAYNTRFGWSETFIAVAIKYEQE